MGSRCYLSKRTMLVIRCYGYIGQIISNPVWEWTELPRHHFWQKRSLISKSASMDIGAGDDVNRRRTFPLACSCSILCAASLHAEKVKVVTQFFCSSVLIFDCCVSAIPPVTALFFYWIVACSHRPVSGPVRPPRCSCPSKSCWCTIYSTINVLEPFHCFSSEDVVCTAPCLPQPGHHCQVTKVERSKKYSVIYSNLESFLSRHL